MAIDNTFNKEVDLDSLSKALETDLTEGLTKSNVKKQSSSKRPTSPPPSPNVIDLLDNVIKRIEVLENPIEFIPELGIFKMDVDVKDLEKATDNASCYDLRAFIPRGSSLKVWNLNNKVRQVYSKPVSHLEETAIVLEPQDRALVPTGMQMDIPKEYSFRIHPRSGASLKFGIKLNNSEGVIDNDYINQVYISVYNSSGARVYIEHQERVAQGELVKDITDVKIRKMRKEPKQKTNRTGGLGHTGSK